MVTEFNTGFSDKEESFKSGKNAAEKALEKTGEEPELVIVFCSSKKNYEEVLKGIKEVVGDKKIIGASSYGEFTEEEIGDGGVAVGLLTSDEKEFYTGIGPNLSESGISSIKDATKDFPDEIDKENALSLLFLDGLSGNAEEAAYAVNSELGYKVSVAGGQAADDLKMEETVVLHDENSYTDHSGVALITSDKDFSITVEHGHEPLSDSLEVTESEGNVVKELDGQPAFEVWSEKVKESAKERLGIDLEDIEEKNQDLNNLFWQYELGIEVPDSDDRYKIRWPGLTDSLEGPMVFSSRVVEGSKLRVMKPASEDSQVEASRRAAEKAVEDIEKDDIAGVIVFECAVRRTILGDDFPESVQQLKNVFDAPILGLETYGEICIDDERISGLHKCTTIVVVIPK